MRKSISRRSVFGMSVLLLLAATFALSAADAPPSPATATDVRQLLQERRDVLAQLTEVRQKLYQEGRVAIDAVGRAQLDLLDAELELAETPRERVTACESRLQAATDLEALAQARYQSAQATFEDVLECKALRLQVQVDLLKAQQAADGGR